MRKKLQSDYDSKGNNFINDPYLVEFDNVLDSEYCKEIIEKYEKSIAVEMPLIDALSVCKKTGNSISTRGCITCDCTRVNIMQLTTFQNDVPILMATCEELIEDYKEKCNFHKIQFPRNYTFSEFRIKRYMPNSGQGMDPHIDSRSDTANRFLSFIIYLNDDFENGYTNFIRHDKKIKPVTGKAVVFPPYWPWLHSAEEVTGGNPKYFLGGYCVYN
jgi:hypothetical protein